MDDRGLGSVARRFWYVACESRELSREPLARTVLQTPVVLFRTASGRAAALVDRCPHRNAPLSAGWVEGEGLRCAYHGWRFDAHGDCLEVPGFSGLGQSATSVAVVEQEGYVWVWGAPGEEPSDKPHALGVLGPGTTTVRRTVDFEATLFSAIENALDVPHTAFLHRGLFRGAGKPHAITVVVTRSERHVEAEFQGEPRPEGLAARILSPSGGVVRHWDRFRLPSIAEVEYRLGEENHLLITTCFTPVDATRTRAFACIQFRLRLPGWLVRLFLTPVATRIFRQDARILKMQTETVKRFGGERFASTEIDVLGPQILRLLRQSASGKIEPDPVPWRKEIALLV